MQQKLFFPNLLTSTIQYSYLVAVVDERVYGTHVEYDEATKEFPRALVTEHPARVTEVERPIAASIVTCNSKYRLQSY